MFKPIVPIHEQSIKVSDVELESNVISRVATELVPLIEPEIAYLFVNLGVQEAESLREEALFIANAIARYWLVGLINVVSPPVSVIQLHAAWVRDADAVATFISVVSDDTGLSEESIKTILTKKSNLLNSSPSFQNEVTTFLKTR
jgi:hypothetical protein